MAAEIKKSFSADTDLIEGHGGVYKVWVDQRLIWDKHEQGRFPEEEEILDEIRQLQGKDGA